MKSRSVGRKGSLKVAHRSEDYGFSSVEDAVAAICSGKMIIVVDDEDRENEGDLQSRPIRSRRRPSTLWRGTAAG